MISSCGWNTSTDMRVNEIKTPTLRDYFVWLRTDYKPRRITGNTQPLSPKTIHNFYISPVGLLHLGQSRVRSTQSHQGRPRPEV